MGEFSLMHIVVLLVIVLVFFGPSRLPSLGKSLGEAIRGFKQGVDGAMNEKKEEPTPIASTTKSTLNEAPAPVNEESLKEKPRNRQDS